RAAPDAGGTIPEPFHAGFDEGAVGIEPEEAVHPAGVAMPLRAHRKGGDGGGGERDGMAGGYGIGRIGGLIFGGVALLAQQAVGVGVAGILVLDDVGKLVRYELHAIGVFGVVPAGTENDVAARGVGLGSGALGGSGGVVVVEDSDSAEIVAEAGFHEGTDGLVEWPAGTRGRPKGGQGIEGLNLTLRRSALRNVLFGTDQSLRHAFTSTRSTMGRHHLAGI